MIKNKYLAIFFFTFALLVSLVEASVFPGFIDKYLGVSTYTIYIFYAIGGLLLRIRQDKEIRFYTVSLNTISLALLGFFGALYFLFTVLEEMKYDNFIFSKFHVHPELLIWPFLLSAANYILTKKISLKKRSLKSFFVTLIDVRVITIPLLIVLLINDISGLTEAVGKDFVFMATHPLAGNQDKMEFVLGERFYRFTIFIKKNTPENAKILIPPFPAYPWPQSGNNVYMRYFLHPRELESGKEYEPGYDLNTSDFDYVLIAWGETPTTSGGYTHGWPKFDVKAEAIFLMEGDGVKTINADYKFTDYQNIETWGLIKINK